MREDEMKRLVEAVTDQVLRALSEPGQPAAPTDDGRGRVLVLGDAGQLPPSLFERKAALDLEDYCRHGNILKYERVIIQSMTTLQLSSLALGLPIDDFSRAVMDALLNGVEVCAAEGAIPAHPCAGKGSAALCAMLEGYARQLRIFGVKPLSDAMKRGVRPPVEPSVPKPLLKPASQPKGSAQPNRERLVTEAGARKLCEGAGERLTLPRGTLITPAAKDVFAAAGITVAIE